MIYSNTIVFFSFLYFKLFHRIFASVCIGKSETSLATRYIWIIIIICRYWICCCFHFYLFVFSFPFWCPFARADRAMACDLIYGCKLRHMCMYQWNLVSSTILLMHLIVCIITCNRLWFNKLCFVIQKKNLGEISLSHFLSSDVLNEML